MGYVSWHPERNKFLDIIEEHGRGAWCNMENMDCKITQNLLYNDIKELLEIKCTQKNSQDKKNEAIIATSILNKFVSIGMPTSIRVA